MAEQVRRYSAYAYGGPGSGSGSGSYLAQTHTIRATRAATQTTQTITTAATTAKGVITNDWIS
jgi:hypothetical protein